MIATFLSLPLLLMVVTSNVEASPDGGLRLGNSRVGIGTSGEVQEIREQKGAEFQVRLELIKSERRRVAVEKLNARLGAVNSSWVEKWSAALSRLTMILDKLEERSGETFPEARDAISVAQEAVNVQADKIYTIEIETEDNLGETTSSAVAQLRSDMKEVWESVKTAREAVSAALRDYKAGLEINNE